ncbi:hypothetical protein [Candidatus Amarolinea dominans]|uniref:hypothetical protein n=1 Tax=Candidatus Amarolinea dominans TaxID=3140696 RepID=UPI0031351E85|nr:hypothetical protein [Anaerolineae bacterium]
MRPHPDPLAGDNRRPPLTSRRTALTVVALFCWPAPSSGLLRPGTGWPWRRLGRPPAQADWVVSFTLLAVLQAGVSVPSSPGKVGIFQYLCQLTLAWFGIAAVQGFAVGVLLCGGAADTDDRGRPGLAVGKLATAPRGAVAVAPWSGEPREPGEAPT